MAQQKKVQKSVMKTLIKETLLDLLESGDKEVLEALDEILSAKKTIEDAKKHEKKVKHTLELVLKEGLSIRSDN